MDPLFFNRTKPEFGALPQWFCAQSSNSEKADKVKYDANLLIFETVEDQSLFEFQLQNRYPRILINHERI